MRRLEEKADLEAEREQSRRATARAERKVQELLWQLSTLQQQQPPPAPQDLAVGKSSPSTYMYPSTHQDEQAVTGQSRTQSHHPAASAAVVEQTA